MPALGRLAKLVVVLTLCFPAMTSLAGSKQLADVAGSGPDSDSPCVVVAGTAFSAERAVTVQVGSLTVRAWPRAEGIVQATAHALDGALLWYLQVWSDDGEETRSTECVVEAVRVVSQVEWFEGGCHWEYGVRELETERLLGSAQMEISEREHVCTDVKYRQGCVELTDPRFEFLETAETSSFVCGAWYDADSQYMVICLNGTYYHYCSVPASLWADFCASVPASYTGSFYHYLIKRPGVYSCQWSPVPMYEVPAPPTPRVAGTPYALVLSLVWAGSFAEAQIPWYVLRGELPSRIMLSPTSLTVPRGSRGTVTVNLERDARFAGGVELRLYGAPEGVLGDFTPESVTGETSVLSLRVPFTAPLGTYRLTIRGRSGDIEVTRWLTLTVAELLGFHLNVESSSIAVRRGETVTAGMTVSRGIGLPGAIQLALEGLPTGVTATIDPNPAHDSTTKLTITADRSAACGTYAVRVRGTAGSVVDTIVLILTILP